jgi:hypothetical protein
VLGADTSRNRVQTAVLRALAILASFEFADGATTTAHAAKLT